MQKNQNSSSILLDQFITKTELVTLGSHVFRTNIKTTLNPFRTLPEYKIHYPEVIKRALKDLYAKYNLAFTSLAETNREWDTDYQYCMMGPNGTAVNSFVQIDMVGLPTGFLTVAANLSEKEVFDILRKRIFEIENSLAMYQLLEKLFSNGHHQTFFKRHFRESLKRLRAIHNRPIALLAVTEQKYNAIKKVEFGKQADELLTDEEVKKLSGFDRFFGPKEFKRYLTQNKKKCRYLLYARTSYPVDKLKNPVIQIENPLLENKDIRKIIKANSITFNIDNPAWETGSSKRISDTKAYLPLMGIGYKINSYENLDTLEFTNYLLSYGIHPLKIISREVKLRAKPLQGTYGCYGHIRGLPNNRDFKRALKGGLQKRGPYIIQPEMETPVLSDKSDKNTYTYIDRLFFSFNNGQPLFLGGLRILMPLSSREAQNGRIHANNLTVFAEIF